MKKILIFYVQISMGHRRAAEAVAKALHQSAPSVEVKCVDYFDLLGPAYRHSLSHIYLTLLRYRPSWWNRMYDNSRYASSVNLLQDWLSDIKEEDIRHYISKENPDAVLCTQAIPSAMIGTIKEREEMDFKMYAVSTDFETHLYWLHPAVDRYFVAWEGSARRLEAKGVSIERITASGIPIDPDFENLISKEEARRHLEWEGSRPSVLMMGGSLGLGLSCQLVERILALSLPLRVAVVTGTNKTLHEELKEMFVPSDRELRVYNYLEDIRPLMRASDLLISKPGGLTSSEAMACGLPIVAANPLPGQERRNARYLESVGAGLRAIKEDSVLRHVERLLIDSSLCEALSVSAERAARPSAARVIAQTVLGEKRDA